MSADAVEQAVTGRRSVRAFLPTPVPQPLVQRILEGASRAPSGTNTQPWKVYVLQGPALAALVRKVTDAVDAAQADPAVAVQHQEEFAYYPRQWTEPYLGRRRENGWGLYTLLGIGRGEPERLFAQLMQVAGRAGRAALPGEVLIQTQFPEHPLYASLVRHDYPAFANSQLKEREQAGFPPYTYQAMLRAEAPSMADSLAFLAAAKAWPQATEHTEVMLYDPVPMRLARRANFERAQLLIESPSRRALQVFLGAWGEWLDAIKAPSKLRWHLEVDPLEF